MQVSSKPPSVASAFLHVLGRSARLPWSWRIGSLVGVSSVLLLAMSALATWNLRTHLADVAWVEHTEQVRYQLAQNAQLVADARISARDYALSGEPGALKAYQDASESLKSALARLKALIADNPKQLALEAQLEARAHELRQADEALTQFAPVSQTAQLPQLVADSRGRELMAAALATVSEMQLEEDRLLRLRQLSEASSRVGAKAFIWATGGLGVLLIVLVVYFARRHEAVLQRTQGELAATLKSIGDAVIATDNDGSIRFLNPVAEQLTGWSESEAHGKPLAEVFQIIGGTAEPGGTSVTNQQLPEGKAIAFAGERTLTARDGTERAIADSGAPIVDATGQVRGQVRVFRDVSAERAVERQLQLRDAELQVINDFARFPIVHLDRRHHYIFVNRAYAERFGLTPEQCAGRHIREVAGELAYQNVRPHIEAVLSGRTVEFESEIPYPAPLGTRWMRCIYAPVDRREDQIVRSLVATVIDITERKHAEEMLRQSQEALQLADRRKDEFLATLSHELRNPLAPIRTAAQILAAREITPQQLQWAQSVIQRQVGHMALLLDDLLDIARVTQKKLDIRTERITINSVVDNAVEAARPLIDSKNHRLSVTLPAEPVTVEGDPLRLSQVLSNLLTNAAKYTDPGGHIELLVIKHEHLLTISVKDNGIGIAPGSIDHIFEMFSQVEDVSGRSEGGLGIGLALVKGLTQLHGGTVEAQSGGLGRGSEFIVRLPWVADATAPPVHRELEPPKTTSRPRVLIADDNRDAAESLAMLLSLAGHEVRVTHSGRAAVSLAQTFRPEVALLDIGMPDLSGYEVARELRREPWGSGLHLIAITGWGQPDDRRRAHEAGFNHHLTKPIDPEALAALIAKVDVSPTKADLA
jgi:PAS domain S-box-containing protein